MLKSGGYFGQNGGGILAEMGGEFWPKSGGFSSKNFGRFLRPITSLDYVAHNLP